MLPPPKDPRDENGFEDIFLNKKSKVNIDNLENYNFEKVSDSLNIQSLDKELRDMYK